MNNRLLTADDCRSVLVVAITPRLPDRSVDLVGVRGNVRHLVDRGVDFLMPECGTGLVYDAELGEYEAVVAAFMDEAIAPILAAGHPGFVCDKAMAAAEKTAQAAKLGIWSMPNQTPPWDFRRGQGVAKMEIGQPTTPVFVSRTGAKYHRDDCRFVAKSKLPSTLGGVFGRYTPCSTCAPPVLKELAQPFKEPVGKPTMQVYVTRSGEKYHRDSCRYLKKSKKSIKLSKAKSSGYTPCKVCKP